MTPPPDARGECRWCANGHEPLYGPTTGNVVPYHIIRQELRPGEFYSVGVPCEAGP